MTEASFPEAQEFSPEIVHILGLAFDGAIAQITEENTDHSLTTKVIRELIAQQILLDAQKGEKDVSLLTQRALAAVAKSKIL